jgi:UDP-N-acetylglucosamine--N-acetylmuramyl-(pentapeptide) pyrophosphoryl-undecaprenol N-acetylglucosamine transferase
MPTNKTIRIIIAGGGTGGHIFPAIAVAGAIQQIQPDAKILFVGAKGKMEMEKVPQAGYKIKGLTIAGFNRSNIFKNITLPFKLIASFFQVRNIFNKFKPTAVFGVGGYSSFPVLKYAQTKGIPTFIHESNAFAGKANQWLGSNCTKIFTGTKGMEAFFPAEKIQITGNPVRKNIVDAGYSKEAALLEFGLLPGRKTVLIIGGSLGAASINNVIAENLSIFLSNDIQLIWQTGKPNAAKYVNAAATFSNVCVKNFVDNMSAAYTAADLVISRSGAMAVAEISLTGKPAIFVPYPHAAEDHQTYNAKVLVEGNAALMVNDAKVQSELIPLLLATVKNDPLMLTMHDNVLRLAVSNADTLIANAIINNI